MGYEAELSELEVELLCVELGDEGFGLGGVALDGEGGVGVESVSVGDCVGEVAHVELELFSLPGVV